MSYKFNPSLVRVNVPKELQELRSWVCWRYEERRGKTTKIPYQPSGNMAKSNDCSTWDKFHACVNAAASGKFDGIGLMLCEDYVAIDLDHTTDEDKREIADKITDEAIRRAIYVEDSPSGEGARILLRGRPKRCGKGSSKLGLNWIEIYAQGSPRYVTITGDAWNKVGMLPHDQDFLDWIDEEYMQKPEPARPAAPAPIQPVALDDQALFEKIRGSRSGAEFERLYFGGPGDDWSSSDLALANILAFWCGRDLHRMDRLFRSSALMRDKWDRPQSGSTYGALTLEKAAAECGEVYDPGRPKQAPAPKRVEVEPEEAPSDDWKSRLKWKYDREGNPTRIKNTPVNAQRILAFSEGWRGVLAYDEEAESPIFVKEPPFHGDYAPAWDGPRHPTDEDITCICYWLSDVWDLSLKEDRVGKEVLVVSKKNPVAPIKDYLKSLQWDGIERVGHWLRTYFDGKPLVNQTDEYVDLVGKLWLISAVARIMQPGCKADHVLVLEGKEGLGKSTALSILGGPGYADTQIDISNKDAYLFIRGMWIVELAELDSLMRAESATSKAFFSQSVDRYRQPYGKGMINVRRTAVFSGSVNHNDYIRDASGGRRYWPVDCGKIDLEGLRKDRDQLWAEAVKLYRDGCKWWPEGDHQRNMLKVEQQARQIDDPWEEVIDYWATGRTYCTPKQILTECLEIDVNKQTRREQTRVGIIMQKLGWLRRRDRRCPKREGQVLTYYLPPPDQPVQPVHSQDERLNTLENGGDVQPVQPVQPLFAEPKHNTNLPD